MLRIDGGREQFTATDRITSASTPPAALRAGVESDADPICPIGILSGGS